jgi:hypothetical protein
MKTLVSSILILLSICQTACSDSSTKNGTAPDPSVMKLEGVVNGGGGKGVQCGNTVRLLDLYEGELRGYPQPVSSGNFDQDLRKYIYKLNRQISMPGSDVENIDQAIATTYAMLQKVIDIPNGEKLEFTNDATLPEIPTNCHFVQIATNIVEYPQGPNSPIEPKVYRDKDLWNRLPVIDQVALINHEYLYWLARFTGKETSSDDTRFLISRMFSGLETYEMFTPIWNASPTYLCVFNSGDGHFFNFLAAPESRNGVQGTGIYFSIIKDIWISSRSSAFIPDLKPVQFIVPDSSVGKTAIVTNPLFGRQWQLSFHTDKDNNLLFRMRKTGEQSQEDFERGNCYPRQTNKIGEH